MTVAMPVSCWSSNWTYDVLRPEFLHDPVSFASQVIATNTACHDPLVFSAVVMYAKFVGAPPNTLPVGRISHKTSPNPIMTAGFIVRLSLHHSWQYSSWILESCGAGPRAKSLQSVRFVGSTPRRIVSASFRAHKHKPILRVSM